MFVVILLSTQSGNFWIHSRTSVSLLERIFKQLRQNCSQKADTVRSTYLVSHSIPGYTLLSKWVWIVIPCVLSGSIFAEDITPSVTGVSTQSVQEVRGFVFPKAADIILKIQNTGVWMSFMGHAKV
jgi:hypothetical protein